MSGHVPGYDGQSHILEHGASEHVAKVLQAHFFFVYTRLTCIYLRIVLTKAELVDPFLGILEEYFGRVHRLRVFSGKAAIDYCEILEYSIKCSGEEGGVSRRGLLGHVPVF